MVHLCRGRDIKSGHTVLRIIKTALALVSRRHPPKLLVLKKCAFILHSLIEADFIKKKQTWI